MKLLGVGFSAACILGSSHAIKSVTTNGDDEAWWGDSDSTQDALWWFEEEETSADNTQTKSVK